MRKRMNLDINKEYKVAIKIDKMRYDQGIGLIRIVVNEGFKERTYYALSPTTKSYIGEAKLLNSILPEVLQDIKDKDKKVFMNFSQHFPVLELLAYRPNDQRNINDLNAEKELFQLYDLIDDNKITVVGQKPRLNTDRKVEEERDEIYNHVLEHDINIEFNKILHKKENNITSQGRNVDIVKIIQSDDNPNQVIISYQNKNGFSNDAKIHEFINEKEKLEFVQTLVAGLSYKKSKTMILSNNLPLLQSFNWAQYKNLKFSEIRNADVLGKLFKDQKIIDYYKNKDVELPSIYPTTILRQMQNENILKLRKNNEYLISNYMIKPENFFKKEKSENGIMSIIAKNIINENTENIFFSIAENTRVANNTTTTEYYNFSIDLKGDITDQVLHEKFLKIFEDKLGYPLDNANLENSTIMLEGFEKRTGFTWLIKENINIPEIVFGLESKTPNLKILTDYIENNEKHMEKKNKLLAIDGKTEDDTLCLYSDASLLKNKRGSTYGFVIRAPNSDKVMFESYGIKRTKKYDSTEIAEEIAVIESLKTLKTLMEKGKVSSDLKVEVRTDNINVVDNLFGKNGNGEKITELFASDMYNKKDINELLSFFKNIDFRWIKGHSSDLYNEKADQLAKRAWDLQKTNAFQFRGFSNFISENKMNIEEEPILKTGIELKSRIEKIVKDNKIQQQGNNDRKKRKLS